MGWLKKKNKDRSREPSPERSVNGDASSIASAEKVGPGKRKFSDRFNDKSKWYWKFVQQRLPGWAPILTANGVVLYFVMTSIICIALGIPVLIASINVQEYSVQYDNLGNFSGKSVTEQQALLYGANGDGLPIDAQIFVPKTMQPPIYIFYELGKYYQNHKRYVRSRADDQLGGHGGVSSSCAPQSTQPGGGDIDPCGLTAWSFFNDTYTLSDSSGNIPVNDSSIAWSFDRNHLYGAVTPQNFNNIAALRGGNTSDVKIDQNEHLMVWLRPGAKPTIRKLWGQINQPITGGTTVRIAVTNRYNTYAYGGQKRLILTTNSWVGGRNLFMGIAYLVVAGLAMTAAVTFLVCFHLGVVGRRKFGDLSQLSWNRKPM